MDKDLLSVRIDERARLGLGRTFQVPRSFENMTAYENIMVSAICGGQATQRDAAKRAQEILELIGLEDKALMLAGSLKLLDRKRLEIGIALAPCPKVLMFDEVAGGLTESEISNILDIVTSLKKHGYSIIWIEHVIQTMLNGTDRVLLLADGCDIICDLPQIVLDSNEVEKVYLGVRKK